MHSPHTHTIGLTDSHTKRHNKRSSERLSARSAKHTLRVLLAGTVFALLAANVAGTAAAAASVEATSQAETKTATEPSTLIAPLDPLSVPQSSSAFIPLASLRPDTPVTDQDLWQRVRRGFVMNEMTASAVQGHELWYANRPDYIKRFVERGSRYLYHIVEEVERRGLPTEIVLLPIIESAFNPQAYSRAHAAGMWQFIPSTGKNFGLKQDWMTDNRRDVLLSTNAALDYLTKLYGMFNSWELAFAAYNCGEGCVGRAIAKNQRLGLPTDFVNLNLPNETRAYVPKLIAVKNIILSPGSYGIELPGVDNRPYFTQVAAPEKIDVKLAARLAEMEEGDFAALNPAFSKPVAQSGTGYFLVPTEKAKTFKTNLDLYRSLNGPMVSWTVVTAKRGESVDAVARRHGMTASYLRATNGPFKERKGKFTQPATFMAPNQKDANAIRVAFDKKVALLREQKREQQITQVIEGDDAPIAKSNVARENLQLANIVPKAATDVPTNPVTAAITSSALATDAPQIVAYTVQGGDTLFSIAKRSNMALNDLKAMNQLTNNNVNIGQILRVQQTPSLISDALPDVANANVATAQSAGVEVARVSTTAPGRPAPVRATARFHTVRSGDTLSSIARRFSTSVESLVRLNKLSAKSTLRVGAKIRVSG
jgi:membrane-bound lytic murein transglycosylase D